MLNSKKYKYYYNNKDNFSKNFALSSSNFDLLYIKTNEIIYCN